MFGIFRRKRARVFNAEEISRGIDSLHDDVILSMGECPLMQTVQAKSSPGIGFETNKYRCVRFYLYCIRHVVQAAIINRGAPPEILQFNDYVLQRSLEGMDADCEEFSRMEAALEAAMQREEPPGHSYWFGRLAISYIFTGRLEYLSVDHFKTLDPAFPGVEAELAFVWPLKVMLRINERYNARFAS